MLLPHIVEPARIRNSSKTLTDNIFSNVIASNTISRNLTATVSGHLQQLLIVPDILLINSNLDMLTLDSNKSFPSNNYN